MGLRDSYLPGTFCWADLSTSDQSGAKAFYASVLGWDYEDMPIGAGDVYSMARVGGRDAAAIGPLQGGPEVPSHWNCYVAVADADASAARAAELGASLLAEPFDVLTSGRMAVVQDPQGAVVSLWQAGDHKGAGVVNTPGALTWNDLITSDIDSATGFYGALFGWGFRDVGDPDFPYLAITNGDRSNGGLMAGQPGQPPAWTAYFAVAQLDDAGGRVEAAGGQLLMGPREVPGGAFTVVRDPQGAIACLFAGELED